MGLTLVRWPQSFSELFALDDDILLDWVVEREPFLSLVVRSINGMISGNFVSFPIIIVMANSKGFVFLSPDGKRHEEDTFIVITEIFNLSFVSRSPVITMSRPWSSVHEFAPWVSHSDKSFYNISSLIIDNLSSENCISMTSNKVIECA